MSAGAHRWYAVCGATQAATSELPDSIGGLFMSQDEGATWERTFNGGPARPAWALWCTMCNTANIIIVAVPER